MLPVVLAPENNPNAGCAWKAVRADCAALRLPVEMADSTFLRNVPMGSFVPFAVMLVLVV